MTLNRQCLSSLVKPLSIFTLFLIYTYSFFLITVRLFQKVSRYLRKITYRKFLDLFLPFDTASFIKIHSLIRETTTSPTFFPCTFPSTQSDRKWMPANTRLIEASAAACRNDVKLRIGKPYSISVVSV
jgi:hypothetical protein